jgi:hypothetical protein
MELICTAYLAKLLHRGFMFTVPTTFFKKTASGGGYLVDNIATAPSFCYSLRKLRSSYNDYCIKIRRNSDNTTQDIGFDANGYVDTAAMTTFTGGNDGFVDTWYDQSGNTLHLTAGTTSNQPIIVAAGTVLTLTKNSRTRAAIRFQASNSHYLYRNNVVNSIDFLGYTATCAYYNSTPGSVPVIGGVTGRRVGTHFSSYYTLYTDGNDVNNGGTYKFDGTARTLTYNSFSTYSSPWVESRYGGTTFNSSALWTFHLNYSTVNGAYNSLFFQEFIAWGASAPSADDINNAESRGSRDGSIGCGARYYFGAD